MEVRRTARLRSTGFASPRWIASARRICGSKADKPLPRIEHPGWMAGSLPRLCFSTFCQTENPSKEGYGKDLFVPYNGLLVVLYCR